MFCVSPSAPLRKLFEVNILVLRNELAIKYHVCKKMATYSPSNGRGLIFYEVVCMIFRLMKKGIHPEYNPKTKVKCACGNEFTIGSTATEIGVEICSKCHPFYTGKQMLVDTAGRIERFKARKEKVAVKTAKKPRVKKVASEKKVVVKKKKA